jgi:FkbM family methyltransferase
MTVSMLTKNGPGHVTLRHFRHGKTGVLLCLREDSYIGKSVELYGEYSEAEVDIFRAFVRPDDIVIDAGALFGEHTLALAELCPDGMVLAFEPQRIPFQVLCANMVINSQFNVDASKSALGECDGISRVRGLDPRCDVPWGLTRLENPYTGEGENVRVRSVDGLMLPRLDFMKVDVEGFEPQVLRGARETIRRSMPVLYVEYNENHAELCSFLAQCGYRILERHAAPVHRFPNYNMRHVDITTLPQPSYMLLAVPPGREDDFGRLNRVDIFHGVFRTISARGVR